MKSFDDYFWPGQNCMRNNLGIHNQIELDAVVLSLSLGRMKIVLSETQKQRVSPEFLKSCHRELFQDCYDWAGEFRECPMGRNIDYSDPSDIPWKIKDFCDRFNADFVDKTFISFDDMADVLSEKWAELNKIHAFRDGNGRSQFAFFNAACEMKGYELVFENKDIRNLRAARDAASDGRPGLLRGMIARGLCVCDPELAAKHAGPDTARADVRKTAERHGPLWKLRRFFADDGPRDIDGPEL